MWHVNIGTPIHAISHKKVQETSGSPSRGLTWSYCWSDEDYGNIRNIIETMLSFPIGRQLPGLWRLYILLEISRCDKNINVKRIYYRAIRSCSWSRALWCMINHPGVRSVFSEKEVADILALMAEKGFVIRMQGIIRS